MWSSWEEGSPDSELSLSTLSNQRNNWQYQLSVSSRRAVWLSFRPLLQCRQYLLWLQFFPLNWPCKSVCEGSAFTWWREDGCCSAGCWPPYWSCWRQQWPVGPTHIIATRSHPCQNSCLLLSAPVCSAPLLAMSWLYYPSLVIIRVSGPALYLLPPQIFPSKYTNCYWDLIPAGRNNNNVVPLWRHYIWPGRSTCHYNQC